MRINIKDVWFCSYRSFRATILWKWAVWMYRHHTGCCNDEAPWNWILSHEMDRKLGSVHSCLEADVCGAEIGLRGNPRAFQLAVWTYVGQCFDPYLPSLAAILEYQDGTPVNDSGIWAESVDLAPFFKYLGKCIGQLIILADITWQEDKISSQFFSQLCTKAGLGLDVKCRNFPTLADQFARQLLANTWLVLFLLAVIVLHFVDYCKWVLNCGLTYHTSSDDSYARTGNRHSGDWCERTL